MSRLLRIEYPGAWYHVMNRGLRKEDIFLSDQDRRVFLALLEEITDVFQIEIHAYSLLNNHYHLLIHTPHGGLSRAMRHLNGVYTQKFNLTHKLDGPLFRGRYKALLVESDEYLLELVRYIHLNPVEAGLCVDPKNHLWTSHKAYLNRKLRPSWLLINEVLGRFGSKEREAARAMGRYVLEGIDEEFRAHLMRERSVLGSRGFQEWVIQNIVERENRDKEIPKKDCQLYPRITMKQIFNHVTLAYGTNLKKLRESQQGSMNEARSMAAYLSRHLTGISQKDLARWMGVGNPYTIAKIQQRFREKLSREKRLRKLSTELKQSILSNVKT